MDLVSNDMGTNWTNDVSGQYEDLEPNQLGGWMCHWHQNRHWKDPKVDEDDEDKSVKRNEKTWAKQSVLFLENFQGLQITGRTVFWGIAKAKTGILLLGSGFLTEAAKA